MKAFVTRAASLLGGGLLVVAFPVLALSFSGGALPNYDGFEENCSSCHRTPEGTAEPNVGTGSITIEAPGTYVAGQPVTLTIRVDNTTDPSPGGVGARQGFQVGVRDADGETVGTYDLGGATVIQTVSDNTGEFVTHTGSGLNEAEWTFDWIPPVDMPPTAVTIYAAGNAANGNQNLTGDFIYTTTRELTLVTTAEPTPEDDGMRLGPVGPNPLRDEGAAVLTLREPGVVSARLVDVRGRTVREVEEAARPAGESPLVVDVRGLPVGTYFLVVEGPEGRRAAPLVVAR